MNQKLDIFIYGEQSKEKPTPVTLEILGKVGELARDFGDHHHSGGCNGGRKPRVLPGIH